MTLNRTSVSRREKIGHAYRSIVSAAVTARVVAAAICYPADSWLRPIGTPSSDCCDGSEGRHGGTIDYRSSGGAAGTGIAAPAAQIFSADDGTTDTGDLQYTIFNILTAIYFVAHFIRQPATGLPTIPDALLGLTSVSAALYIGKKATERSKPTITKVFPSPLVGGDAFWVIGTGLTGGKQPILMSVTGKLAEDVAPDKAVPDRVRGKVPVGLVAAGANTPIAGTVQVSSSYGAMTDGYDVTLV